MPGTARGNRPESKPAGYICLLPQSALTFLFAYPNLLAANPAPTRHDYSLPRMGTMFRVEIYSADDAQASAAADAAFARAEELEQIMSDYRPDSELMNLSREGAKAPLPVSSDLYDVLAKSLWTSELSGGVFDVSIGPVGVAGARLAKPGACLIPKK